MGPIQNCVARAGLLVGWIWSATAEAQVQAPSASPDMRSENTGQSAGGFRAVPAPDDDVRPTATAASGMRTCARGGEGEIVVCGRPVDERYRLKPLTDKYQHRSFLGKTLDIPIARGVHIYGLGIRVTF